MRADQQDAGEAEDDEDVEADVVSEGVELRVGEGAGNEIEGEIEVCLVESALCRYQSRRRTYQREVCKEQANELIYEFYVEEHFTCNGVVGGPYLLEVDERVDGCEEGAI